MKYKALKNQLIVERQENQSQIEGTLLFRPDSSWVKNKKCKVLDVGPHYSKNGTKYDPDYKAGDYILVVQYDGAKLNLVDKNILVINEDMVLGIVPEDAKVEG